MRVPDGSVDVARPERDVPLAPLTTLGIGGAAAWYLEVDSAERLAWAAAWADNAKLPVLVLGEGSNLLIADDGFRGVVLRNRLLGIERQGREVRVAGGENLGALVRELNRLGLAGLERLYGIPGSVAGALVGNAGAYGQEIGERVISATLWSPASGARNVSAAELDLRYRHSRLKEERHWFVLDCRLLLDRSDEPLQEISDEILTRRLEKYPVGLRCPGSFFKNVIFEDLSAEARKLVPSGFITFGKIPAGRLLEAVGANGARRGGARIADYHGNLLVNEAGATADDVLTLASEYAGRVWERFKVRLQPEIRIVGARGWPIVVEEQ
jgi:UDP-N-acetylenolpyruvoylglucosamine reductase